MLLHGGMGGALDFWPQGPVALSPEGPGRGLCLLQAEGRWALRRVQCPPLGVLGLACHQGHQKSGYKGRLRAYVLVLLGLRATSKNAPQMEKGQPWLRLPGAVAFPELPPRGWAQSPNS